MQAAKEPLGNPATGEVPITLGDGKTRIFCLDIDALCLLDEVFGPDLNRTLHRKFSAGNLAGFLYAGCYRDAAAAREPWTLAQVRALLERKHLVKLWERVKWAIDTTVLQMMEDDEQPGETPAALPGNESRGDTTTR